MENKGLKTEIQTIQKEEIYDNTNDNTIKITESKAKLLYHKYTEAPTKSMIIANLGLAIAFITPLLTSNFKNIWDIPSIAFRDIFIAASAISIYKFLQSTCQYVIKGRSLNEKNFIRELSGQEEETIAKKRHKQNEKIKVARREGMLEGYKLGRKYRR